MARIQGLTRNWLPPVMANALKRWRKRGIRFEGQYSSWEEAASLTDGYAQGDIVSKVLESTLKVKTGEAVFERDSVLFDKIVYSWPVTAGLMLAAARHEGKLDVLDYGGALGSHYFQNRKFLDALKSHRWNVVEQAHYFEMGKRHLEDGALHFYQELDACLEEVTPNVVLASSVLQYLPNPLQALSALAAVGADVFILDRTPYILDERTATIRVQRVPESVYQASYPCWFLEENQVIFTLEQSGYLLLEIFDSLDKLDAAAVWKGHIFCKVK